MKKRPLNFQFFSNHIETLEFKSFCEGGSLEYVATKQKLKNLYFQQEEQSRRSHRERGPFLAYSLYINPLVFFDINFIIAAGAVVLVAVLERKLAQNGIINVAAILSGVLRIGFPVVTFGAILILISKLGGVL